jgi:hypothetical protein
MLNFSRFIFSALLTFGTMQLAAAQQPSSTPNNPQAAFNIWSDEFNDKALDESKWERFSFEGGGGGKVEMKDGALHLRSMNKTRSGVRSKQEFKGDRFSVEAAVARVGNQILEPGDKSSPLGFAALTIMFDSGGRNRIEWIFTSEQTFEIWSVVDGQGERLDNRKLGTKLKNPVLAIVRRGDEFLFILNGPDSPPQDAQIGLTKVIKNMPRSFRVMLYGFGSSENDWDNVRVVTPK